MFPHLRMRRGRMHAWSRRLVREHGLSPDNLIWPIFIREGAGEPEPVASMPGVARYSLDNLALVLKDAVAKGIPAVALFPVVESRLKTEDAAEAINPNNLVCRAVRAIKKDFPNLGVICDVALDPYTTHGHDGLLKHGEILNDETVEVLKRQALVQVQAGCDVVAPSDMMDGRIGAIRQALEAANFKNTLILSYAAKYASAFYGPFRDALGSAKNLGQGDKRTYQMDPGNIDEALREVALDLEEGADWIMVKPGLPYLDVIHAVKSKFGAPTFAYQVSGEYAMIKAAGERGMVDAQQVMLESLLSLRRAGADAILTYAAVEVASVLTGT